MTSSCKGSMQILLLGQGVNQQKFQNLNQTGYGLAVPGFYNITNASNLSLPMNITSMRRLWGMYGQLSLAYNNYLFLELTGKTGSFFHITEVKKCSYFYPSASASFVLTDAFNIQINVPVFC